MSRASAAERPGDRANRIADVLDLLGAYRAGTLDSLAPAVEALMVLEAEMLSARHRAAARRTRTALAARLGRQGMRSELADDQQRYALAAMYVRFAEIEDSTGYGLARGVEAIARDAAGWAKSLHTMGYDALACVEAGETLVTIGGLLADLGRALEAHGRAARPATDGAP